MEYNLATLNDELNLEPWHTVLPGIADCYEEDGNTTLACGYRYLAEHKCYPNINYEYGNRLIFQWNIGNSLVNSHYIPCIYHLPSQIIFNTLSKAFKGAACIIGTSIEHNHIVRSNWMLFAKTMNDDIIIKLHRIKKEALAELRIITATIKLSVYSICKRRS